MGQLCYPKGMCTCRSKILVADTQNKRVQVFNQYYEAIRVIEIQHKPETICCSKRGYILLGIEYTIILIIDQSGNVIKKLASTKCFNEICVNSLDQIILSNCLYNKVQILDLDGNFIYSFGYKENDTNQLETPYGIIYDDDDNILVVYNNKRRIYIFNPMGSLIQRILVGNRLSALCILQRRIIVAEEGGTICTLSN